MLTGDTSNVLATRMHITPTLQNDGAFAQLNQAPGSKPSAGTGTHNDDRSGIVHLAIGHRLESRTGFLAHEDHKGEIDIDGALASINASFQYPDCLDGPCINSLVLTDEQFDVLFVGCLLGQNSYLVFLNHNLLRYIQLLKFLFRNIYKCLYLWK